MAWRDSSGKVHGGVDCRTPKQLEQALEAKLMKVINELQTQVKELRQEVESLKPLTLYALIHTDGDFFSHMVGNYLRKPTVHTVSDINEAKIYSKLGTARGRMTKLRDIPDAGNFMLLKILATNCEIIDESERLDKVAQRKAKAVAQRAERSAKWARERAERDLARAQAELARLNGKS